MRPVTLLASFALCAVALPANAALLATQSTYDFAGRCSDCAGTAAAELVLSNYTPGDAITASNFVSFHYDGTNLLAAFTISANQVSSVSGSMSPPLPGTEAFTVVGNSQIFRTFTNGNWCAGSACFSDYGTAHLWRADAAPASVPEPFTLALFAPALLAVAAFRPR